jgi:hypothetical protein
MAGRALNARLFTIELFPIGFQISNLFPIHYIHCFDKIFLYYYLTLVLNAKLELAYGSAG